MVWLLFIISKSLLYVYLHNIPCGHICLECKTVLYNSVLFGSVDDLQRLLKDKEAYNAFFNSLDQVKTQNNVRLC